MAVTWLDFILSRRYALTVTGDPMPKRPAAAISAAGGAVAGARCVTEGDPNDCVHDAGTSHGIAAPCAENPTTAEDGSAHPIPLRPAAGDAGPFLILPNNPSLIDPLLLYAHVAGLKPLVVLRHEQSPALRFFAGSAEIVTLPPAPTSTHDAAPAEHPKAIDHPNSTATADTLNSLNGASTATSDAPNQTAQATPTNHADHTDHTNHANAAPTADASTSAAERAALTRVAEALAQGRSVILWPSPQVQHTGYECVPAHNAAFSLLRLLTARGQALPELFLVRAEGLWGSRFSRYSGHAPAFGGTLLAQIPAIFLGPFLPRRPVRLVMRRHTLRQPLERRTFQNILNGWFGAGHENALLVPRVPLCRSRSMPLEVLPQAEACAAVHAAMQTDTSPALQAAPPQSATAQPSPTADSLPAPVTPVPLSQPAHEADLPHEQQREQSGANSPESPLAGHGQVGPHDTNPNIASAAHAAPSQPIPHEAASKNAASIENAVQAATVPNTPLADLSPAVPRTPPLLPVQHALTRQGSVTDASYGQHFSRRTLLGLAKAIGTLLGPVPATRIGMALPCGTGALATYIAILDCTLEDDRIPVILDPNMSPDQLAQCAQETGITHVVTSRSFNGRGLPPNTLPVYLEDITSAQIMRGSALSFMGFAGTTEVDSLAAIICSPTTTSGPAASGQLLTTEALNDPHSDVQPLFLQHQDLMASLHNLMEQLIAPPLNVHSLSILACLPPHSPLGLLTNVVLPLTCGVPIVTVNATHSATVLARSAENYSVNFFTGSPASMASMLHEARSHLPFRYVMLSQEPCPAELLALIPKACPHASIFSADMHGNIVLL